MTFGRLSCLCSTENFGKRDGIDKNAQENVKFEEAVSRSELIVTPAFV